MAMLFLSTFFSNPPNAAHARQVITGVEFNCTAATRGVTSRYTSQPEYMLGLIAYSCHNSHVIQDGLERKNSLKSFKLFSNVIKKHFWLERLET